MGEPNQYALSQALGSRARPIARPQFGNLGLLSTTAATLRAREQGESDWTGAAFTYEQDRVVAEAFEEARDGASTDALLWDRALARAFVERCRHLGLDAPDAFLKRRLLNIRKNSPRYKKHGIVLSPTTRSEPQPSIVPRYAHVIEFALVRLRYRYGATIDDILLDSHLGDQLEQMALDVAPDLSPQEVRLGALYIRKSRFLAKNERQKVKELDAAALEDDWSSPASLAEVDLDAVPEGPGLIKIRERDRYLYIARNSALRPAIAELAQGRAFSVVAGGFWEPDLDAILVEFVAGKKVEGAGIEKWERRLIHDRRPVFNWPIVRKEAA